MINGVWKFSQNDLTQIGRCWLLAVAPALELPGFAICYYLFTSNKVSLIWNEYCHLLLT